MVHLWECHPKPKPGRQNKPMQRQTLPAESAVSPPSLLLSLPCSLNKHLCPSGGDVAQRGTPSSSLTHLCWLTPLGASAELGQTLSLTHSHTRPRGPEFLDVFRLLGVTSCSFDGGGGHEASPLWKISARRGKPQLVFPLCKQPPSRPAPRINPSLPSPFQTTQWHINKHAAHTNKAHSCTAAGRERRVGRWANALQSTARGLQALREQISCSHHKIFIWRKPIGGPSAFPGEKYTHLTLKRIFLS